MSKPFNSFLFVSLITLLVVTLLAITGENWQIARSPKTGVCYERHVSWGGLAIVSQSPVDEKFCIKEGK